MKFALLSIRRGGFRTAIVPAICAGVTLFVLSLVGSSDVYARRLEDVYDNTRIMGFFTSYSGRQVGGLGLNPDDIAEISGTGLIDEPNYSQGKHYMIHGRLMDAAGREYELPNIEDALSFNSGFAYELFVELMALQPELIYTTDLKSSPEFFHADGVTVTYLEGFDEYKVLNEIYEDPRVPKPVRYCIVSDRLLKPGELELGDTIIVITGDFSWSYLKIAGSFASQSARSNIYTGARHDRFDSYSSVNFTLTDSRRLSELKDYLDERNYGTVGILTANRSFLLIDDKSFLSSVGNLRRQISYFKIIWPALYALVGAMSFIVSYLLMLGRKSEFAVMRGIGTGGMRVFMSFFSEQLLLCLSGCAAGMLLFVLSGSFGTPSWSTALLFACLFMLGCAVSILVMNRTKVLKILTEGE